MSSHFLVTPTTLSTLLLENFHCRLKERERKVAHLQVLLVSGHQWSGIIISFPGYFKQSFPKPFWSIIHKNYYTIILTDEKRQEQAIYFCRPLLMWEVADWVNYFQLIVAKVLSRPHNTLQLYTGVLISNYEQTWHIHRTILTGTYTAKWQVAIVVNSSSPVFCKGKKNTRQIVENIYKRKYWLTCSKINVILVGLV